MVRTHELPAELRRWRSVNNSCCQLSSPHDVGVRLPGIVVELEVEVEVGSILVVVTCVVVVGSVEVVVVGSVEVVVDSMVVVGSEVVEVTIVEVVVGGSVEVVEVVVGGRVVVVEVDVAEDEVVVGLVVVVEDVVVVGRVVVDDVVVVVDPGMDMPGEAQNCATAVKYSCLYSIRIRCRPASSNDTFAVEVRTDPDHQRSITNELSTYTRTPSSYRMDNVVTPEGNNTSAVHRAE